MREKLLTYLQSLQENNLAFFAFRELGSDDVNIHHQTDNLLHNTPTDSLSYVVFNKFKNTNSQVFISSQIIKRFKYNRNAITSELDSINLANDGKNNHLAMVKKAIISLENTALEKVVLSRKQDFKNTQNFQSIFLKALDIYTDAHVYFFHHPKVGSWIGATPETLLSIENHKLKTMSLAGTAIYKEGLNHIWGEKEIEEQQIVTDYITTALKAQHCKEITATPVTTVRAGNLIHLKSVITATIKDNLDSNSLLNALHPTPAVCGLPVDLAKDFIHDHENYDREFYTGYFGIVNKKLNNEKYYVNLRCMKLSNTTATLYVGGGITASSNAMDEYQETVEKLKTMARLLL